MRVNGSIQWSVADLSGWTTANVNGATKFWIRIRRTANPSIIPPVEQTVQRSSSIQYNWNDNGDVNIASLTASTGLTVSGIPVNINKGQSFRTINAIGSGTQTLGFTDEVVVVTGSATFLEVTLPALSSTLGQTIRIQLPGTSSFYPNLENLDVETQPGEKKDGVDTPSENIFGYRLTQSGTPLRGGSFMAVGGDLGWLRLADKDV